MKIDFFSDHSNWGLHGSITATARGHDSFIFSCPDQVRSGSIVFMRMHNARIRRDRDKRFMHQIAKRTDIPLMIPDSRAIHLYDEKISQYHDFKEWMPQTWYVTNRNDAYALLDKVSFPIMSKANEGSSSNNVRFVTDKNMAIEEIKQAFSVQGLPLRYDLKQTGYLLWQEFLPDNEGDYRITIVGSRTIIVRRLNRDDRPMASGAGRNTPINNLNDEIESLYMFARNFADDFKFSWIALDVMKDYRTYQWKLIEISFSWPMDMLQDAVFFGDGPERMGQQIWEVLIDEIEAGNM